MLSSYMRKIGKYYAEEYNLEEIVKELMELLCPDLCPLHK